MKDNNNLRKLQLRQLEILKDIDMLCKKHDIKYSLAWGTALGAVRHSGFIPWDDDIDICMKPIEYQKFLEISKTELPNKYFLQNFNTERYSNIFWTKIRENNTSSLPVDMVNYENHWGICVDVFPLMPLKKPKMSIKKRIYFKIMTSMVTKNIYEQSNIKNLNNVILKFIPRNIQLFLFNYTFEKLYELKDYNFFTDFTNKTKINKFIFEQSIFSEIEFIEYEKLEFPIMKKYDKYLTICYNDYMKIPELNERIDHGDTIIDFEKSYLEYQKRK